MRGGGNAGDNLSSAFLYSDAELSESLEVV